jgi:hypothetical protein
MCAIDYERPEFCTRTQPTARKIQQCDECRRYILPGESYERVFGKWEGRVNTFKTCAHCRVLQKWLVRECDGFLYGGLEEEIEEHAREYSRFWLYRALKSMRRKWRRRDGSLMPVPDLAKSPALGAK